MQGMHPDLVGTAGDRAALDQGCFGELTGNAKPGFRRLAIGTDPHDPLAGLQIILAQRRIDHLDVGLPLATHQCQVLFAHGLDPQLLVQAAQGAALLGDQQHTGGVAIETMHQFQKTGFRAQGAQPFDDPEAQPAAAVNGHAGRLVEHDHGVVFKQDLALQTLDTAKVGRGQFILFGDPHGRNPYLVAGAEFVLRFDALFVDAYFPLAKDAIDQALGDAL